MRIRAEYLHDNAIHNFDLLNFCIHVHYNFQYQFSDKPQILKYLLQT